MLLVKQNFLRYQQRFFDAASRSPYTVTLKVTTANVVTGSFDAFVGDSERTSTTQVFPCLYEKTVNPRVREKYGLPDTVDGVLFISPKQLLPVYGTFRLDKNKTTVLFEGREQIIENITYLESMFDSCIAVQINLKDSLKGG